MICDKETIPGRSVDVRNTSSIDLVFCVWKPEQRFLFTASSCITVGKFVSDFQLLIPPVLSYRLLSASQAKSQSVPAQSRLWYFENGADQNSPSRAGPDHIAQASASSNSDRHRDSKQHGQFGFRKSIERRRYRWHCYRLRHRISAASVDSPVVHQPRCSSAAERGLVRRPAAAALLAPRITT